MSRSKTKLLIASLKSIYEGPAWHGPAVKETLAKLDSQDMLKATDKSHNIVELINHMTAWRNYAIKKLQGEDAYEVSDTENFSSVGEINESIWQEALIRLENSQNELLKLISEVEDDKLKEIVAGRKYSYYFLLHGLIHHDVYHLGQIVLLAQLDAASN